MAITFHITPKLATALPGLQLKIVPLKPIKTKQWMRAIASDYQYIIKELSVVFCTDEEILDVNKTFLSHDYYTDIITFDYTAEQEITGEMYISLPTVLSNALEYNESNYNELYRVIAHGLLHLCGENDLTSAQKEKMRKAENTALHSLKANNIFI